MPNWAAGVLKVRGSKESLARFVKEAFIPVTLFGDEVEKEIHEDEHSVTVQCSGKVNGFHLKGTRRNFVEWNTITVDFWEDDKEVFTLVLDDFKAAWGLEAGPLVDLSREYELDFKAYVFERGQEFNQEIEIRKGELVKDAVIHFEDYEWECIFPNLGG